MTHHIWCLIIYIKTKEDLELASSILPQKSINFLYLLYFIPDYSRTNIEYICDLFTICDFSSNIYFIRMASTKLEEIRDNSEVKITIMIEREPRFELLF